ncbi:MAG: arsenate reductase [Nitrosopumilaceae archaeon]|nr:arsenate reductase [Nitrosopumilaceae archaeon]NIU00954.1 arsenate reductase [Nitrosopumilaceae archaeon]NIU87412.1 arsenate reductase [Nitrosopumilaceae archaeon]NIV65934.1 arsenate reductase [Nitrosopumilaceae archaeon]NIX61556.1 arsenate reductase [Nitrosopumilaceae archaeon]
MKVYYKPTCITCKRTISELDRLKKDVEKRDFFKEPFSESEIKKILKMSGLKPQELLRKRDKKFKELNLDKKQLLDSKLIKLMSEHPGLIRRPIIIHKDKAYVGKVDTRII